MVANWTPGMEEGDTDRGMEARETAGAAGLALWAERGPSWLSQHRDTSSSTTQGGAGHACPPPDGADEELETRALDLLSLFFFLPLASASVPWSFSPALGAGAALAG